MPRTMPVMSDSEIAVRYKQARDKGEQITILAQLNDISTKKVIEILQKCGIEDINRPKAPVSRAGERAREIIPLYLKGYLYKDIAFCLGISEQAARDRVYRCRKAGLIESGRKRGRSKKDGH